MVTSWESANKDNTNAIHLSVELQFAREKVLKLEEERREILGMASSNSVLAHYHYLSTNSVLTQYLLNTNSIPAQY